LGLGIFLIVKETTQLTTQLEWVQKLFQWLPLNANLFLKSNGR
jgi:hypothetical protein